MTTLSARTLLFAAATALLASRASATLTGQYLLEEGAGLSAADSSGFGRDGILTSPTPGVTPQWTAGLYKGSQHALLFDSTMLERVDLPQNQDFIRNSPGATIMAWVRLDQRLDPEENFFGTIAQVNTWDPAAFNGYGASRAAISSSKNFGFRSVGSIDNEARDGIPRNNEPPFEVIPVVGRAYFVVGVYDYVNGSNRYYVNGVQPVDEVGFPIESVNIPGWNHNSADKVNLYAVIGASPDPTAVQTLAWNGVIDGVRIYDTALTSQEILDIYNAERLPLPGDFNDDSLVNDLDLTKWQGDFGPNAGSDSDGDGDSDGADFLAWQRAFSPPASALGVPEPDTLSILIALSFAVIRCGARGY